mmetsp:Transcript_32679/g.105559  ORF Transcript_32679/g.105559 Transcript_32679/m.105559 type:complete len:219 (+) Transcript_32679:851-1507(+)
MASCTASAWTARTGPGAKPCVPTTAQTTARARGAACMAFASASPAGSGWTAPLPWPRPGWTGRCCTWTPHKWVRGPSGCRPCRSGSCHRECASGFTGCGGACTCTTFPPAWSRLAARCGRRASGARAPSSSATLCTCVASTSPRAPSTTTCCTTRLCARSTPARRRSSTCPLSCSSASPGAATRTTHCCAYTSTSGTRIPTGTRAAAGTTSGSSLASG